MKTIDARGLEVKINFEEVFPDYTHTIDDKCYIYLEDMSSDFTYLVDKARYEEGEIPLYYSFNGCEINEEDWYEFRIIVDLNKGTADTIVVDNPYYESYLYLQVDDAMPQVLEELKKRGMTLEDLWEYE